MDRKIAFKDKINTRIVTTLLVIIVITAVMVIVVNQNNIRNLYEQVYTERVLFTNALIATTIEGADVKYYVDLMEDQGHAFKQRQVQFFYDRRELWDLQETGASEEEQQELIGRLTAFQDEMDSLKTDRYWEIINHLKELQEISNSTYLYVMANTGLVNAKWETLYTFIFDADDEAAGGDADRDGLGTSYMPKTTIIDRVVETGQMMDRVLYEMDDYGELFFAYAPIIYEGEVIAVIGTDLSLEGMNAAINTSTLRFNAIFLALAAAIILVMLIFLRRSVTKPLSALTDTAHELSEGNVYAPVPESALKQRGEIGLLAGAVNDMSGVYQDMIMSTDSLFEAANVGKLDVRNDETKFKGDIRKVIKHINNTLDVTTQYLNGLPESVFIMSKDLECYFRNEHSINCFGHITISEFISYIFPETEEKDLKAAFAERFTNECKDSIVWINEKCFSVIIKEIELDKKTENSVLIIANDITDLMKEKENAQAAAQAKSDFLSRMSHEMRTPMNAIIGMAKIADNTDDISRLRYCLGTIGTSSTPLLGIINDILDMSKIEAGKFELEEVPMNIEKMLMKVSHLVDDSIKKKNQKFTIELPENLDLDYIADDLRLSQVVTNLLANAVKFTPENGTITLAVDKIATEGDIDTLHFSIVDDGIGMTEEQIARLFNAFEQADGSTSRKFGGTGLGLAISKNIIEKMGGTIYVESLPDVGSKFSFDVKLKRASEQDVKADDAAVLTPEPPDANTGSATGAVDLSDVKILLAEDIDINREVFLALLEETNVDVDIAENGVEAISKFKENPDKYDLILMDIQMPEMDGHLATRTIREMDLKQAKDIPIVAMTANAFKEDVEQCLASGMNDHIAKPIDEKTVIEKIVYYTKKK